MKKKIFLMTLASLLAGVQIANAASICSYTEQAELNEIASTVKLNYEVVEYGTGEFGIEEVEGQDGYNEVEIMAEMLKINIINITKDIYVEVKINNSNTGKIYHFIDSDNGTVSIEQKSTNMISTYQVTIYSNYNNCIGDKLKTIELKTPMYNELSENGLCEGVTDLFYCQRYVLSPIELTDEEFMDLMQDKVKEEVKKAEEDAENKNVVIEFIDKYKILIISVIVITGVVTTAIVIKNRRSTKL